MTEKKEGAQFVTVVFRLDDATGLFSMHAWNGQALKSVRWLFMSQALGLKPETLNQEEKDEAERRRLWTLLDDLLRHANYLRELDRATKLHTGQAFHCMKRSLTDLYSRKVNIPKDQNPLPETLFEK